MAQLRPKLHRYCARMIGSALAGEDVLEDAFFDRTHVWTRMTIAVRLRPWLFPIAHNRCIHFLGRREAQLAEPRRNSPASGKVDVSCGDARADASEERQGNNRSSVGSLEESALPAAREDRR